MVSAGTSVAVEATFKPGFTPTGTLYMTATDPSGTFDAAVPFSANGDGSYQLFLSTSTSASSGRHSSSFTLNLCADPACNTHQVVPAVSVPFDINVLNSSGAWPGDHLTALSAWPGVGDWSMYQANAAHTGYVPVQVNPNKFTTRWRIAAVPASTSGWNLPGNLVATSDDKLFVAGGTTLYSRKEADASVAWQYDFGGLAFPSTNPPAIANGVLYISAGQQSSTYLFAFNSGDGSLRFKSQMASQWEHFLPPTVGPDGSIYANAGGYDGLYGFDATGQQLFFDDFLILGQISMWTPAVDSSAVYAYSYGNLRVLDPTSGSVLKTIPDPTYSDYVHEIGGSAVLGNGFVFAANYSNSGIVGVARNTLLSFKPGTDSIAWQVAGSYPSTPAYSAGVLYVANEYPLRLEVRAEADGALLWSWVPPAGDDTDFYSEVLLTSNLAFVSTNTAVYGIDLTSHKTVWSYPQPGRLALSKNGVLYIHGDTYLTAVNLK